MKVRVAHISLQFSDTNRQQTRDIEKIFKRAQNRRYAWITGTEAGPGSGNMGRELVRVARERGYRPWVPSKQTNNRRSEFTDCWLAVREDLIKKGTWRRGYKHVIPGARTLENQGVDLNGKRWAPKGLVHAEFDTTHPGLGPIAIGAAHYLTGAQTPDSQFWKYNKDLGETIAEWAEKEGKGKALVFYGGDQNMQDRRNNQPQGDTFFGGPMTSTWDELRKWENTGHGNIDVIATYNRDGRVSALRTNALNDRQFHLHTDHFLVEATLDIKPLKDC